jgi:hypothetical protein
LLAVSCRSSSICEAVGDGSAGGGVARGTVNGGASWSNQALPSGQANGLMGLVCVAAPAPCFATGVTQLGRGLILVYR